MKNKLYIVLLTVPTVIFAATGESGGAEYDIIPRAINFFIFAGILYYLIAEPIKNFFVGRKTAIADRLNSIQEKLKESNKEKEEAKELITKAKVQAKNIVETTKEEIEIVKSKIFSDLEMELEIMKKGFEDQIQIERRKMTREVISEILDEMFKADSISLEKDKMLDIVMKKVA
ncbi:MAG: F0F1 ATP synthase subunit B [Sulfurospirillaceae bacterium]|nr:F0F1 ATP synthase subunit B [Sulfurospirillaceae bacterium]